MFHLEPRTFDVSTQTWFNATGLNEWTRMLALSKYFREKGRMVEICVIKYVIKNYVQYNGWQWGKNNEQLAREIPNTITIY